MLRFNDTDPRELRSDMSLLRGDRDKPRENSYLEQYQQTKLLRTLLECCSAWETGIFNISRTTWYGHTAQLSWWNTPFSPCVCPENHTIQNETRGHPIVTKVFLPKATHSSTLTEPSSADSPSWHAVSAPIRGCNKLQVKRRKWEAQRGMGCWAPTSPGWATFVAKILIIELLT